MSKSIEMDRSKLINIHQPFSLPNPWAVNPLHSIFLAHSTVFFYKLNSATSQSPEARRPSIGTGPFRGATTHS